jgi:hypothetical protein
MTAGECERFDILRLLGRMVERGIWVLWEGEYEHGCWWEVIYWRSVSLVEEGDV